MTVVTYFVYVLNKPSEGGGLSSLQHLPPEGPVQLGEMVPKSFSGDGLNAALVRLKWSRMGF
jgi:hypothetical protein